jgi:hypothetical protein
MKVKLQTRVFDDDQTSWKRSRPFMVNPRGLLVHRVRYVTELRREGKVTHLYVGYLCGNGCLSHEDVIDDCLLDEPPKGRLVCSFCECRAAHERLPSADKLVGRHVHKGGLRVFQTCCQHKPSNQPE